MVEGTKPNITTLRRLLNQSIGLYNGFIAYPSDSHGYASKILIDTYEDLTAETERELKITLTELKYIHTKNYELIACIEVLIATLRAALPDGRTPKPAVINLADIHYFPNKYYALIEEAQNCYFSGYYRACCTLCGVVWDDLLAESSKNLGDIKQQEKRDAFVKKYRLEKEKSLIEQLHDWRTDSAHLHSTEFNEDKAVINLKAIKIAVAATL